MKKFIRTITLTAALIALLVVSTTALGATLPESKADATPLAVAVVNAPDPEAAFANLTPDEQDAVVTALATGVLVTITEIETVSTGGGGSLMDSGDISCLRQKRTKSFYTLVGKISKPVWVYGSETTWCFDGTEITYVKWTRPVSTMWPWTFVGHIDEDESGGVGEWSHYDYTQGHFRQCAGGQIGCINDMYPSISKWQYADGTYS